MADFNPEDQLARLIVRAASLLSRNLHQTIHAHGYDITAEQFAILIVLWEEDGISQTELANRSFKDKPTVTRMLKLLEQKELIRRQRNMADQRAFEIFLTPLGREQFSALLAPALEVITKAQTDLSNQEVGELKRMLRIINQNLN